MKKSLLKLVSLTLVLMLLFTVATGCGKTNDTSTEPDSTGDQTSDGTDQPSDVDEPETQPEPEPEPEPTYDFGGRTITYGAWWDTEPKAGTSEWADNWIARNSELEEKYNYKMAYANIPYDQYLENFTATTLAGEPMGDVLYVMTHWFFPGLVGNGFLYPLSDLEAYDFSEEKWNQTILDFGKYDGKNYAMATGRPGVRGGLFWNKTMFEREGLPNLYDLQNSKTWTWDKMLEIAQKATKDLDGDGIVDQWGLAGDSTEWAFVYSNGAETIKQVDGQWKFTLTDPAAIEGLQTFQDFILKDKVYLVPPAGSDWQYPGQQFQDGKVAMYYHEWWKAGDFKTNMQDEYGFVLFPMGPKADEYVSHMNEEVILVTPATVKNPNEVAVVWNAMTEPWPDEDPEAWKEGFEANATDVETIDTIAMIQEKNLGKLNRIRGLRPLEELSWSFLGAIKNGSKTAQVAIEEVAQQAQNILDDGFKK